MRRVVVTGMGVVSPLGTDLKGNFEGIVSGKSVVRRINDFDVSNFSCKVAAHVPFGIEAGQFNPDALFSSKEQRHMDLFVIYGIAAGLQALADSGYEAVTEE